MGFSYTIERNFREPEWIEAVRAILAERARDEKILPLTWRFHGAIISPEDFSVAAVEEEGFLLLPDGGVRGVGIAADADEIEIAIQTMGSKADWELAGEIVAAAHRCGGIVRNDNSEGVPIDSEEAFSAPGLETDYQTYSEFAYRALRKAAEDSDGPIRLPVRNIALTLTPEEILSSQSFGDLEEQLAARMARYGHAFLSSVMVIRTEKGDEHSIAVYYPGGCIIPGDVQLIGFMLNQGEEAEEIVEVPTASARAILRDRIEDLGDALLIPEMDLSSEPSLIRELRRASENDPWPDPLAPAEEDESRFEKAERERLKRAPMLAFLAAAGADGDIDEKELGAFGALIQASQGQEDSPFFLALQDLRSDFRETAAAVLKAGGEDEPFNPFSELRDTAEWIDRHLAPEEGSQFKEGLYAIAKTVAEASGGGLFGFGKKISKPEAEALRALAEALRIDPAES